MADAAPVTAPTSPTSPLGRQAASPRAATLWKAYSRGYDLAGRWHTVRVAGTIGLALLAPIISFNWPSTTDVVAAAASIWLLASRAALGPAEDWERHRAVNTQELFDTYVFQLAWNPSAAGRPTAEENIAKAAAKQHKTEPTNWYADTKDLPRPLDVVLCQRSSAAWGRGTHFTYAVTLVCAGTVVLAAGLIIGVASDVTLSDYLLRLFLPMVPALLDTIDMFRSHWATSRQKGQIEHAADGLWALAVHDLTAVTLDDCRRLQDQSYRLRRDGPRVPSWLYRLRHDSDEGAMRQAADQRITEYRVVQAAAQ